MAEAELSDSYPVRENGRNPVITRDVNEDRFLQVSEENVSMKRHMRKQEDRIRQLATKLVRVIGEKSKRTERDDILIGNQKSRIEELEALVTNLRGKLSVARQQLGSCSRLVPGTTKSGRPKSSRSGSGTPTGIGKVIVPDQVTRLLLDAKGENHLLRDQVKHLQDRWQQTNQELMTLKEQMTTKDVEYQDELVAIRSQTQLETELKQKKLADNIQFIRLQRDSKRTASWLATYEAQCRSLEANLNSATEAVSQLEMQLSAAQEELRNEQKKFLDLLKQNEENSSCLQQLKEANAQLVGLKDENKILKDANEVFLAKSLEISDRKNVIDKRESELNSRIEHLEAMVKHELQAKSDLITALTEEKAKCLSLDQELKILDKKCIELTTQLRSATSELAKAKDMLPADATGPIVQEGVIKPCEDCSVKDQECNALRNRIAQLKAEIAKVKELLKTQVGINKEYQEEIEALTSQLANSEALHEKERKELMYIFSDKTHKLAELEQSLETLRQRIPAILAPQPILPASTSQPTLPLVEYETSGDNLEVENNNEGDPEFSATSENSVPIGNPVHTDTEPPYVFANPMDSEPLNVFMECNKTDQEEQDDRPKLKIQIQKFVHLKNENFPRLFVTWENEVIPRQYSPIVSDGIFNAESVHYLEDFFQSSNTSLDVQLHQAVGTSDSRTLAFGHITPGAMQVAELTSTGEGAIGHLFYSYTLENCVLLEANNNEIDEVPEIVPQIPVPVPRKLKTVTTTKTDSQPTEPGQSASAPAVKQKSHGQIPETLESSSESSLIGKRKSILRREIGSKPARSGKRRVRVSDKIEERKFDSDSDGQIAESFESEPEQVDISPGDDSPSLGQVLVQSGKPDSIEANSIGQVLVPRDPHREPYRHPVESDISGKRRSRRISKQFAAEESDEVSSTLSVGSEGETSRNISDIETISEESFEPAELTIEIFYARFTAHTRLLSDPHVKKFFIEYKFLNYPPEETETDSSQPKPLLGRKAQFDFKKTFLIDTKEKKTLLREIISTNKNLQFTLVTEPSDNDTIDCEDIGYAHVSLVDILNTGNDITRKEISIFDPDNLSNEIGVLSISVLAFTALNTL